MEIHLGLLAEILVCVFVCVLGIGICIGEDKKATPRTPPGTRPVQSLATLTPASTEIGLERFAIPLVTSDQSTDPKGTYPYLLPHLHGPIRNSS
jgi:hypothetical protein